MENCLGGIEMTYLYYAKVGKSSLVGVGKFNSQSQLIKSLPSDVSYVKIKKVG